MASNFFADHDVDVELETEIEGECTDSPFEYDDDSSEEQTDGESENEDIYFPVIPAELDQDGDSANSDNEELGARPYMFQPVLPEGQDARRAVVDPAELHRLENLDW